MAQEKITVVVMPSDVRAWSGVESATQRGHGLIRLHYEDGRQEIAIAACGRKLSGFDRAEEILQFVASLRPHAVMSPTGDL